MYSHQSRSPWLLWSRPYFRMVVCGHLNKEISTLWFRELHSDTWHLTSWNYSGTDSFLLVRFYTLLCNGLCVRLCKALVAYQKGDVRGSNTGFNHVNGGYDLLTQFHSWLAAVWIWVVKLTNLPPLTSLGLMSFQLERFDTFPKPKIQHYTIVQPLHFCSYISLGLNGE